VRPHEMREIYEGTRVLRRPTYGIVKGYHDLPYICLGGAIESDRGTLVVKGTVHVSPQFIIRPSHFSAKYEELFDDDELEPELTGRMFGFLGFPNKPVECSMEHLEIQHVDEPVASQVEATMDRLDRYEDITTGVILTPNSRYYPVSVERFIASILDDEFSV